MTDRRPSPRAARGRSAGKPAQPKRMRRDEARQAKAKEAPVVTAGASGASVKSGNGEYEFKFRGLVQGDGRFFSGEGSPNDTFLLRRLRPTFEGSLGKLVGFRLTPELAGDSATVVDAYIDLKFDPAFTVRAGKVKGPVGLERLQQSEFAFHSGAVLSELSMQVRIGEFQPLLKLTAIPLIGILAAQCGQEVQSLATG